jgi:uncharacterized lipoprotein
MNFIMGSCTVIAMQHKKVDGMYAHIKVGLQLKDVIVQAVFGVMWRKLGKIIEKIKRPINV